MTQISNQKTTTSTGADCQFNLISSAAGGPYGRTLTYPYGNTFRIYHNGTGSGLEVEYKVNQSNNELMIVDTNISTNAGTDICYSNYSR